MDESGLQSQVSGHFGRAPYFLLFNTTSGEARVVAHRSVHTGQSQQQPPEFLRDQGVEIMLCGNLGPKAVKMFEGFGVEVYSGANGTAEQAISLFKENKLQMATDQNACAEHRHGHGHDH